VLQQISFYVVVVVVVVVDDVVDVSTFKLDNYDHGFNEFTPITNNFFFSVPNGYFTT